MKQIEKSNFSCFINPLVGFKPRPLCRTLFDLLVPSLFDLQESPPVFRFTCEASSKPYHFPFNFLAAHTALVAAAALWALLHINLHAVTSQRHLQDLASLNTHSSSIRAETLAESWFLFRAECFSAVERFTSTEREREKHRLSSGSDLCSCRCLTLILQPV